MEKGINKQAVAVGLAFFAALFGAGNLIFPSYMGLESGKVLIGFVMFIILDAVFSALGLVAESKRPEQKNVDTCKMRKANVRIYHDYGSVYRFPLHSTAYLCNLF